LKNKKRSGKAIIATARKMRDNIQDTKKMGGYLRISTIGYWNKKISKIK
jgi:hypothetical protein